MHRILVSYEKTAAVVYSINKDRQLFQLNIDERHMHKGKLLALEWMTATEILLGFEKGHLEIYNVEGGMFSNSAKPIRILKFDQDGIVRMNMEMFNRVGEPIIIMEYSVVKEGDPGAATAEDQLNESSVPDNNLITEVVIMKGAKLTEYVYMNMSSLVSLRKDEMFLSAFGLFMLHEKYHTLNLVTFGSAEDVNAS